MSPMRMLAWATAVLAGTLIAACSVDATKVRMKLEAAPGTLFLGAVGEHGDQPGRHYEFWAVLADGTVESVNRFVIVPTSEDDSLSQQTAEGGPQVRYFDTGDLMGYANTNCAFGACGGAGFVTPHDLTTMVGARITREDDGDDDGIPSNDLFLIGPVQPYAQGTLRGGLVEPTGQAVPRCEITVIPAVDNVDL